ncbi:MAG: AAA family ATPase [Deferrisomatales bacterium]
MYSAYFGLTEEPFALTPDPRFLYLSPLHREALAHLLYGMGEAGGFVQLTGEVGTGKTTLCRSLLEQAPEEVDVGLIFNPRQTPAELVASVCDEFHVLYPPGTTSLKVLTDGLNRRLLEGHSAGRRAVLVVDEAQNLSVDSLEQIRLLTNLETTTSKLLQILLIGQPELRALMGRPELRQLAQRVTARYHLAPLTPEETAEYVRHRLGVAGASEPLFSPGALSLVHRLSGGVPRLVNVLCDRALLGAYAQGLRTVGPALVRRAAREVRGEPALHRRRVWAWGGAVSVLAAAALTAGWLVLGAPGARWDLRGEEVSGRPGELVPGAPASPSPVQPALPLESPPSPAVASLFSEVPRGENGAAFPGHSPADAPSPPFPERLAGGGLGSGSDAAFATLFRYWGVPYGDEGHGSACDRAERAGLRCYYGRGNWTTLAFYGLPAVLELRDRAGARHHGVVSALDETRLTLEFGGASVTLPRGELEPLWFGDFLLLWEGPPEGSSILRLGSEGPDVLWLRDRLDRAQGQPPGSARNGALFGLSMRQRVQEFQLARGLVPDGLAGEQTFIQLNAAAPPPSVPRLGRVHGAGGP